MKKLIIASLMSIASVSAFAGDFAVGASVGQTKINGVENTDIDDTATAFNLTGSYKVMDNVAVQVGYHDLGKFDYVGGSAKAKGYSVSGVVSYPVYDKVSVLGSVGAIRTELKDGDEKFTKTSAVLGAGVAYQATKEVAVTGGVTHIVKLAGTEDDATQFNVGVQYSF